MGSLKIVVGSGWWCSDDGSKPWTSDDIVLSPQFFELWYRQIKKYLAPQLMFVTDSHSPLKPDHASKPDLHWCTLDRNYGHSLDIQRGLSQVRLCGWTRSVIMACAYALCCEADYLVYVEQDCLLRGSDFLNVALRNTSEGIVIGQRAKGGRGTVPGSECASSYQQAIMVIRKDCFPRFLAALTSAEETDGDLSPEYKMERYWKPFDTLAVSPGRSRPIDFTASHYYAQSFTVDEVAGFLVSEGLDPTTWFPGNERLLRAAKLAREVGLAEFNRMLPPANAAIRKATKIDLFQTASPYASKICDVVRSEDNILRFDSRVPTGSKIYWSREYTGLDTPPASSDIELIPGASYEVLLPMSKSVEGCALQCWLIQYSSEKRLLHNMQRLREGENRVVFRAEMDARFVRVAIRCAGSGRAEIGPVLVNRLEKPTLDLSTPLRS